MMFDQPGLGQYSLVLKPGMRDTFTVTLGDDGSLNFVDADDLACLKELGKTTTRRARSVNLSNISNSFGAGHYGLHIGNQPTTEFWALFAVGVIADEFSVSVTFVSSRKH